MTVRTQRRRNVAREERLFVRIEADLKEQAQSKAEREGVSLSEVIRRLLAEWVKDPPEDCQK
jgi:antitoxin component of RelBE/YafQ-DinJ toxin-antitoxin module